jgi:hypothetical protein
VILFTCIAEISTVDEEPIFRILPLKLPFFQHSKNKKKNKKKKDKSNTQIRNNNIKKIKENPKLEVVIRRRTIQFLIE